MEMFTSFMKGYLKATSILQLKTADFYLSKMAVQYQYFPILMVQILFSQIQKAPGPDFRTVGKSLKVKYTFVSFCLHMSQCGFGKSCPISNFVMV